MKLREQMYFQFTSNGLTQLLKEFQEEYAPKKGMRFNKSNITYEIGAPKITDSAVEYEISSKIPQDEINDKRGIESYFKKVKKILEKESPKPISVEMENIVWEAEKENEKKREYVKLVYQYPFESLYDEKKIIKQADDLNRRGSKKDIPVIPGIMTTVGKLVLMELKENFTSFAKNNMKNLIKANEAVKKEVCK